VFLTHLHADFLAGHLELRGREGATIYRGARPKAEYPFSPLHDGDEVMIGDVRLVALEMPGHSGARSEAAVRLERIGFESVAGYLDGGPTAFSEAPELVDRIERVTAVALADELAGDDPPA
jgi:hypothetical protein